MFAAKIFVWAYSLTERHDIKSLISSIHGETLQVVIRFLNIRMSIFYSFLEVK
jgi:hypothetical protein